MMLIDSVRHYCPAIVFLGALLAHLQYVTHCQPLTFALSLGYIIVPVAIFQVRYVPQTDRIA